MLHSEIFYAFFITALAITLVVSMLAKFKVPPIVGFILTGLFIGPSGLNLVNSLPAAHAIAELGIILLMFSLGLEISIDKLRFMLQPLIKLGLAQVLGTMFITAAAFHFFLNFDLAKSIVFGALLSLSSTAVVLKLLQEKRETESPYGRVSIYILLFQDIAALPLMALIPMLSISALNQNTSVLAQISNKIFWILLFLAAAFLTGRYLINRFFNFVTASYSREVFFFSAISLTFLISLLAEKAGLSMALGSFVAGVLISESTYNKQALAELSPLRDIFLGFFFASVGMMVNLEFIISQVMHLLWLIPVLFFIKASIIYLIARFNGHPHGISVASSLSLTQIGEFSFILGTSALGANLMSETEFQYFLALSVLSLLATPLLFNRAGKASTTNGINFFGKSLMGGKRAKQINKEKAAEEEEIPEPAKLCRRAIVIGLGHAGLANLNHLHENNIPCVGIDYNANNLRKKTRAPTLFGDATKEEVLEAAGTHEAFLVIITLTGKEMTSQVLAKVRNFNPNVHIIVRLHYLLETEEILDNPNTEQVISEVETAKVISEKALAHYAHLT